jgi:hypothetical protein
MSAEPESRPVDNGAGDPKDDTGDKEPKKDDRCGRARARGVLAVRQQGPTYGWAGVAGAALRAAALGD